MKAIGFKLVKVTNPQSGEELDKIRCTFDNGRELNLLTDKTVEAIKADRDALLSKVVTGSGEYGDYCRFSYAETLEEF